MSLSKRVVETLLDLVEIKLSCIEVYDREDKREVTSLEQCRQELRNLVEIAKGAGGSKSTVASFPAPSKGRSQAIV